MINDQIAYQALKSRDPRFDGLFFVGVTSTKIYCRPICTAKTPLRKNCQFFANHEIAEKHNFRPCLRCRPELAPGNSPLDGSQRIAYLIAQRMEEGLYKDGTTINMVAKQFALTTRQIGRIIQKEFGVSPIELILSRRILLAKQLLTETKLPITEIAYASGFLSLRRFNDAFLKRYRMPPSRLRKAIAQHSDEITSETIQLQLPYRPPYDWHTIVNFLKDRMIKEVEYIDDDSYMRTIRLGKYKGWIRVTHLPIKNALTVELAHSLVPVLPAILLRIRHLFDLNANPEIINAHLCNDKMLSAGINRHRGMRVAGAFDSFEMVVRAVLGQQITVKAATTMSCRFADAFGEKIQTPFPQLTRLTPTVERLTKANMDDIAKLGIIKNRTKSILALAQAIHTGTLSLEPGSNPIETIRALTTIPGVGEWTAQYIAMRALRWPDAFPKEDLVLRKKLGGISAKDAEKISQAWRPWRSYAVLQIWHL